MNWWTFTLAAYLGLKEQEIHRGTLYITDVISKIYYLENRCSYIEFE